MSLIVGALEGAVAIGGVSAIETGLDSISIPKDILRATNSSGLTDHALEHDSKFYDNLKPSLGSEM